MSDHHLNSLAWEVVGGLFGLLLIFFWYWVRDFREWRRRRR